MSKSNRLRDGAPFGYPLLAVADASGSWRNSRGKEMARISLGVIGLGTVGTGVIKLLQHDPRFRVKWVAVRDKTKRREVDLSAIRVTDQPFDLVNDPELEIIIEVAGGTTPAYEVVRSAVAQGKH